ncbi:exported hypothetical protein [Paraburkholderia ribeironis]|uniref:Uncharacterized protein n=1 Tax=Paraburkholderia ribeironis TaxID=1247936 RepID=A0A1N7SHT0_9BURK|nr:exported hypothetical protein [Paraburkholderia ribeironis]
MCFFTKNKISLTTTRTPAAMAAVPTHTDPLSDAPALYASPDGIDDAGYFMSRHAWKLQTWPEPLLGHGITVANSARLNLDADLTLVRLRNIQFDEFQWASRCFRLYSFHPGHGFTSLVIDVVGTLRMRGVSHDPQRQIGKLYGLFTNRSAECKWLAPVIERLNCEGKFGASRCVTSISIAPASIDLRS